MDTATAATARLPAADLDAWTRGLFRAIDARDVEGFLAHLTPDARFAFANFPVAAGTAAIRALLEGFFGGIRALEHTVEDSWSVPGHRVMRGTVRYTRLDGREVAMPFCNVLGLAGARVSDYRIYIDPTALLAP
jgi:ketosteroid isomerase-like protein